MLWKRTALAVATIYERRRGKQTRSTCAVRERAEAANVSPKRTPKSAEPSRGSVRPAHPILPLAALPRRACFAARSERGRAVFLFRMITRLYWFKFLGLPVTVHLRKDHKFLWTRIYGAQIGPWFIGVIRGQEA